MTLSRRLLQREFYSRAALFGIICFIFGAVQASAAELIMFERAGCSWCEAFDRDIAPIYQKTEEGLRAPLRRVDTEKPLPSDLTFIETERLTPLFVLVDRGREIGRIRGYAGEDFFWGMLDGLMKKLDASRTADQSARIATGATRADE